MMESAVCEKCSTKVHWPRGLAIAIKCKCGHIVSLPKTEAWVRLVRLLRKPQDKGIGDTVARIAARVGGERFKAWSKRIGMPCGCTERQKAWNERWPY